MAYTTIDNPELYFQCKLYTGNGSNGHAQTFDGDENMQPNMVWIKSRSAAENHHIFDSVRGANKRLIPNDTSAEFDDSSNLQSFDSDGFTLGTADGINKNTATFVCWGWKEASEIFDIVSYTGNGSNRNISHSLSAKPAMILVKQRSASRDWWVYNKNLHGTDGATGVLYLSTNDAAGTSATTSWNSTAPTTSVFSLGTTVGVNADSGTYIAYCFAEKQGFSKFSSFVGNGNNDSPFVYTGFRPALVILKGTASNREWLIHDNKRDTENVVDGTLYPNTSDAEGTGTARMDFLSNGFKLREDGNNWNASGETYIYAAFAEAPFVNSNGVPCNAR
tara:strand:- start:122 stop:1123 length:1002 start_codon:yes stop_codon:yes gene_type:complete